MIVHAVLVSAAEVHVIEMLDVSDVLALVGESLSWSSILVQERELLGFFDVAGKSQQLIFTLLIHKSLFGMGQLLNLFFLGLLKLCSKVVESRLLRGSSRWRLLQKLRIFYFLPHC